MELLKASAEMAEAHKDDITELVWATGPASYGYQFGSRDLFNRVVSASLRISNTLFGWDGIHLAIEGDKILGLLISFPGPQFEDRKKTALASVSEILLNDGHTTLEELGGLIERAEHARWLNPELRSATYYIHAVAVTPEQRGRRIGMKLMEFAKGLGRESECTTLELDVLADNPAVSFYLAQGLSVLAETKAPDPSAHGVPPEYRMGMLLAGEEAVE